MALWSTALAVHKRHDRATGSKQLDKAIRGRSTDFELGRKQCHLSGCHLASPVLQEFPNCFRASARFIPKRFVDFVGKWVTHCRNTVDYLDRLILTLSAKIQAIFSN